MVKRQDNMAKTSSETGKENDTVLVIGVYLADQKNNIQDITANLQQSRTWSVDQKWIALGKASIPEDVAEVTALKVETPSSKFQLLNRLIELVDLSLYRFLMVCDDDVILPDSFVDDYLGLVLRYDFSLAQPSRTHDSYIDWAFVEQLDGITARWTRYVEIGPVFSFRDDAFSILLPFDESSPMGWGYDFAWPCLLEEHGMRMGIIDAVPVSHSLRKPVAFYEHGKANNAMTEYLAQRPHLSKEEAFRILESYV